MHEVTAMAESLSVLELNILKAKGMSDEHVAKLPALGITSKAAFATIGDAGTLRELTGIDEATAKAVMLWAVGAAGATTSALHGGGTVVVDSADIVYCVHCKTRQPKDYQPGDLCPSCGKQAEPVLACYWCGSSGPGKFCRQCGAEHVLAAELELALQLRRDGLAKDDIPKKLSAMSVAEKEALFARARKATHGHGGR